MESSHLLTDDCWGLVINHLNNQSDQSHLDRISLASKQLLAVTNQLLDRLKIFSRTKESLPAYLKRFTHVKIINLSEYLNDLASLLYELAHSDLDLRGLDLSNQKALPLESLKEIASEKRNFQVLVCSKLYLLQDSDVIGISSAFPSLEELDISYPSDAYAVTDGSIKALSTKLSNLRKINLAGNASLTDESLKSLSSNCAKLTEVILQYCNITQVGVAFLLKNNSNLVFLSLGLPEGISSTFKIPFAGLRVLHTLELYHMTISDHLLFQIADAKMPLMRFSLCHCKDFSFAGVVYFLHTYHSLEVIALTGVHFLNDHFLALFCNFFKKATTIKLNCSPKVTEKGLSTVLEACPKLEKLEMAKTLLGDHNLEDLVGRNSKTLLGDHNLEDLIKINSKLEFLIISGNLLWTEERKFKKLAILCPNLVHLDLSGSIYVNKGMIHILETCKKIRHLKINRCHGIKEVEGTLLFKRLETVAAACSSMDDRSLSMFARRSPELRRLDLRYCKMLTEEGIIEALKYCDKLIDIDLRGCPFEPEFGNRILGYKPTLRNVVPPNCLQKSSQRNPYLRLICPCCSAECEGYELPW